METLLIPLLGMHPGPFLGPSFGGLLVALLIAFLAIRLFRTGRVGPVRLDRNGATGAGHAARSRHTAEDAALATLKQRLASGDITTEEYLERSSVLRRPPTTEN